MTVALPEGDEKVRAVRTMFDTIAPRYDLVNRVMTFGLDGRWRRRAVRSLDLGPAATVIDLACGMSGSPSVRAIRIAKLAPRAPLMNHLWPLITHSSPSG